MSASNILDYTASTASKQVSDSAYLEMERFFELGRLSASLLHEISTPLTAAMLWLDMPGKQPHHPHVRQARHSIQLLHRYVEAARQQVRCESRCRDFLVQAELDEVLQILVPLANRRQVTLCVKNVRKLRLYGDPVKFQQIIANLINNAVDSYSKDCSVSKKQVNIEFESGDKYITIKVRDRGCGLSSTQLTKIFEPFYSTKSDNNRGLGIGLYTIKKYIEQDFCGTIRVKSLSKQGTQIIFKLKHMNY